MYIRSCITLKVFSLYEKGSLGLATEEPLRSVEGDGKKKKEDEEEDLEVLNAYCRAVTLALGILTS